MARPSALRSKASPQAGFACRGSPIALGGSAKWHILRGAALGQNGFPGLQGTGEMAVG